MPSMHLRAKDVFLAALSRPAAERASFVQELCGDDTSVRQEVESLLAFHEDEPPSGPPQAPDVPFQPGEVFAGRYRMISRIGRGGMGDVWGAHDLVLETSVALKLIDGSAGGRERILNEVRLARQITHPAICRVFDVGESGGRIFFSMERIQGEDLATLLRRVKRLPSEKVIEIARQLCAGLSAAHAQGVLHRDLKPANILIDTDGFVRITDFGIAIPRTDSNQHRLTGTPGYMAPEQRTVGTVLDERTDVYALALVLYEMMVGRYAFATLEPGVLPPPPSSLVPDVDPQLERIVMQALSPEPAARPASARALADALPGVANTTTRAFGVPGSRRRAAANRWLAGAAIAVVVGVLAVTASFVVSPRGATLTERDTIVLAEFENMTGEPVFDGALKVALAVAVEQSPFLKVFPDAAARDTLRLMQRSPDERLTRSIARDIARREQLKAFLAGSIVTLGRNYVIALEAINAETGDVMAREQAEATSKEDVLTALGSVTSRLREKLGESLASIEKFDVKLPKATTASLEALHAYSLALPDGREVPQLAAIPHLKRAIELDQNFAMAHALLSSVYANTGQISLAPAYSRRAFELRDSVSERERFYISWRYYRDAIQDWERALELARSWTATYPREAFAFNALGSALVRLGQFEQSIPAYQESIRLDPRFTPAYGNLAASLLGVNRLDEARAILNQAIERKLDFSGARRLSYLIAFVQNDTEVMTRDLEASIGPGETNAALGWQGNTSAFGGRVAQAHDQFRRGIQASLQANFKEVAADMSMRDAEMHAIVGQCADARREVAAAMEIIRDTLSVERAARTFALCGVENVAVDLSRELAKQYAEATLTQRVSLPTIAAVSAVHRGEPAQALALLDTIKPYERAPTAEFWPAYLSGLAHLHLKDGAAAEAAFRSILGRRGEVPASMLFPLAHLGAARAAAIAGETAKARSLYEAFFALWKDADVDLLPLKEARAEYANLR
jgi:eukaryotic-like serine/threonine-protein kinase